MSNTSESSESPETLPRPELNPLLNPVLAENMGRWAEVYFTSPPEKREEAVLDLLRELEAGNNGHKSTAPKARAESMKSSILVPAEGTPGASNPPMRPALVRCSRCGNDNPVTHQFCGMCGATLSPPTPEEFRTDSPYEQHVGEMESVERAPASQPAYPAIQQSYVDESRPVDDGLRSDPYDLSMLQGLREREIDDYEYDERSYPRYRYYLGAVLVILLLMLGYMAWRSGQTSQASRGTSAPPPPTVSEPASPAPATNPAVPSKPKVSEAAAASSNKSVAAAVQPQPAEGLSHPARETGQTPAATIKTVASTTPTEPPLTQGSGAEEFAMAQRYLAGGDGRGRNTTEAVKWLWKAIGKHNGPATLQLADLYLKGDGVAKNCDQARVILDSAARRGMAGAGERLRNLQAFGCQ